MDKIEHESWITDVYTEFWNKAEELASKECPDNVVTFAKAKNVTSKMERRDTHLNAMVAMFIATMEAPIASDSDEENKDDDGEPDCAHCDSLLECQEKWEAEHKQN